MPVLRWSTRLYSHVNQRPFNVETYNSSISVLGTRFNVCLDGETGDFSAALLRGSIKVSNKISPDEIYILRPNQMVRMEYNHFIVEHISVKMLSGKIIFSETSGYFHHSGFFQVSLQVVKDYSYGKRTPGRDHDRTRRYGSGL